MKNSGIIQQTQTQLVAGQYTYYQQDCVGKGAWGSVFKAKNSNGDLVALKKMNKFQIQATDDSYKKLLAQISSLKKVKNSQYIIQFIDVFKTQNYYYIVTQFYENSQDLFKFMQRNKTTFPQLEAIKLWKDILQGVAFLHNHGIMHRDLKLQNIIYIPHTKQVKIIDFGLALSLQKNEIVNSLVGSPMFISPQVLKKQKYTDKCDIWSLGVIFYYTLFGSSPYGDPKSIKQIQTCMQKIQNGTFKLPSQRMSDDVRQLIEACLQYDQNDRPEAKDLLQFNVFRQKQDLFMQALKNAPKINLQQLETTY